MARILLFQFSDLHFGCGFHGTVGLNVGLGGHDLDLCRRLKVDLQKAHVREFNVTGADRLSYLIGGDLTRKGSDHDFHLVYTYLYSQLNWTQDRHGAQQNTSLGLPQDAVNSVPGNHDHWTGQSVVLPPQGWRRPPAYNPGVFPDHLAPTPWRQPVWSVDDSFALELFGVDSNEGLKGSTTNFRARGCLSQEELHGIKNHSGVIIKKGLEQLLQDADADQAADSKPRVRAVVCHHAFGNRGGLPDAWPLETNSRNDLLGLCRQYRVRAVLTGHTHYFKNWLFSDRQRRDVWELRCGSTLQRGKQPQPQGFLVHEIAPAPGGTLSWRLWKYQHGQRRTSLWAFYRDPNVVTIQ